MQKLPIGIQSFKKLRRENYLYVDKTDRLVSLISKGEKYFLSRPRRFGKSLTLSTLEAMFAGKAELFRGLAAEDWVKEQSKDPSPVLRIDMSGLGNINTPERFNEAIIDELKNIAEDYEVEVRESYSCESFFKSLIRTLSKVKGPVVVLIDEYDKLILDSINDLEKAEEMRKVLRSFYTTIKSCDEYLRFVFITGISRFSKMGVFSAMNNLEDISLDESYGDIVGYTQLELEDNFSEWIEFASLKMNIEREKLLDRLEDYYDGFSFDGKVKLYNPFSIMQCLKKGEFNNYWYESGSPSFIVEYMKTHQIKAPDEYRHKVVKNDFVNSAEIERADPCSFLFQSGYLTIEKKQEQLFTLDYPNREVLDSISSMYLKLIYKVEGYALLGNQIWKALREAKLDEVISLYNTALSGIPYDDYSSSRNEFWYRSMFIMLLRGAGIIAYSEPHTSKGRADIVLQFQDLFLILEFKFAKSSLEVEKKRAEGLQQLDVREYAKNYAIEERTVVTAVIVADDKKRQVTL
ncbi:AAA family ATPase [bacterium]|nr:AAA family ATPase [bacterium]